MHISAYYLLQNSNFLNCIRRFIRSNECLNLTKFVWALVYAWPEPPVTLIMRLTVIKPQVTLDIIACQQSIIEL